MIFGSEFKVAITGSFLLGPPKNGRLRETHLAPHPVFGKEMKCRAGLTRKTGRQGCQEMFLLQQQLLMVCWAAEKQNVFRFESEAEVLGRGDSESLHLRFEVAKRAYLFRG
jgi:hypothetical protein